VPEDVVQAHWHEEYWPTLILDKQLKDGNCMKILEMISIPEMMLKK
jgi:hypothetical protein